MWYKNVGTRFFCSVTEHAFHRQTDRQTERPWQYRALHYMQLHGKNAKSQTRRHFTDKSSSLVVDLRIVKISINALAETQAAPVAVFLLGTDNGSMDGAEVPMSARRQHRSRARDNWPIASHLRPFSPSRWESLQYPGSHYQPCLQGNLLTFFLLTVLRVCMSIEFF